MEPPSVSAVTLLTARSQEADHDDGSAVMLSPEDFKAEDENVERGAPPEQPALSMQTFAGAPTDSVSFMLPIEPQVHPPASRVPIPLLSIPTHAEAPQTEAVNVPPSQQAQSAQIANPPGTARSAFAILQPSELIPVSARDHRSARQNWSTQQMCITADVKEEKMVVDAIRLAEVIPGAVNELVSFLARMTVTETDIFFQMERRKISGYNESSSLTTPVMFCVPRLSITRVRPVAPPSAYSSFGKKCVLMELKSLQTLLISLPSTPQHDKALVMFLLELGTAAFTSCAKLVGSMDPAQIQTFSSGRDTQLFENSAKKRKSEAGKVLAASKTFPQCSAELAQIIFDSATPEDPAMWWACDLVDEFERQGAGKGWSACRLNENFTLCKTYPRVLYVPKQADAATIRAAAASRTINRFQVLSYYHRATECAIIRSAQPSGKDALMRFVNSGTAAEDYVKLVRNTAPSRKMVIIDLRPFVNAVANCVGGGSYEGKRENVDVKFAGIENIRVVRHSMMELQNLLRPHDTEAWGDVAVAQPSAVTPAQLTASQFYTALLKTSWLDHVCGVISTSVEVARIIAGRPSGGARGVSEKQQARSVLVHCSDGWDRTSQVSALAQVLLDPFFRTVQGLCVLIDKDFVQFGHRFRSRSNYCNAGSSLDEDEAMEVASPTGGAPSNDTPSSIALSPRGPPPSYAKSKERSKGVSSDSDNSGIFLLFCDSLHQLVELYPHYFEYSSSFLVFLLDCYHGGYFGTFINDSLWEIVKSKADRETASLWTCVANLLAAYDEIMLPAAFTEDAAEKNARRTGGARRLHSVIGASIQDNVRQQYELVRFVQQQILNPLYSSEDNEAAGAITLTFSPMHAQLWKEYFCRPLLPTERAARYGFLCKHWPIPQPLEMPTQQPQYGRTGPEADSSDDINGGTVSSPPDHTNRFSAKRRSGAGGAMKVTSSADFDTCDIRSPDGKDAGAQQQLSNSMKRNKPSNPWRAAPGNNSPGSGVPSPIYASPTVAPANLAAEFPSTPLRGVLLRRDAARSKRFSVAAASSSDAIGPSEAKIAGTASSPTRGAEPGMQTASSGERDQPTSSDDVPSPLRKQNSASPPTSGVEEGARPQPPRVREEHPAATFTTQVSSVLRSIDDEFDWQMMPHLVVPPYPTSPSHTSL